MHCFDRSTPLEETLSALDRLVRQGKVRYLGASNFTASRLARAVLLQRASCMEPLLTLQPEYSLLVRETEWELLPLCLEEGLGVLPWSPLAGGWLSGKYRRGQAPPPDSRVGRNDRWDDQPEQRESERTWRIVDTLVRVAEKNGRTPAQVALNWLVNRPGVTCPIIGARTMEQLDDNLGSTGWSLDPEDSRALDEASSLPLPYPYRFIQRYTRKRDDPAGGGRPAGASPS
jgi:aryl-alcohol dehydrogenase-like predicted oxidoreductase